MPELKNSLHENRVIVCAPIGRDGPATQRILEDAGIASVSCTNVADLCAEANRGAGILLITDDILDGHWNDFLAVVHDQPAWSDIPILVFTENERNVACLLETLGAAASITVLERPIRIATLISAVRSALRARSRQYQTRDLLLQLNEADRQKDLFLATLSHELRTPLTAIVGWVRMMRSHSVAPDHFEKALETIERNAMVQSHLIEDILSISRIITGKLHLERKPVDLSTIVRTAADSLSPAAQAKRIQLEQSVPSSVTLVAGDEARLHQVIWNLLSNAIKFTPEGGRVRIDLEGKATSARITVTDTGKGIDPAFLPHVFETFKQADNSYTRDSAGLGLGLAIVQHLVKMHDGSVHAHSIGLGSGSTFVVELPALAKDKNKPDPASVAGADSECYSFADLSGATILLVEDHEDTRQMINALLTQCGAQVVLASSAAEAVRSFRFSKPDLIVSDIGLPDMDGYDVLHKIADLFPGKKIGIPAIAVTGFTSLADRNRALEAGYSVHFAKPVEPSVLTNAIASLLWGKKRQSPEAMGNS
jgi:signal transduction histidine kinase/CheY-like chemotaxis protein